ncbi:hypothetical protein ACN42_g11209 [Penicillium freii]|uniref:Uncharacterized protein n=1 Tax=Penicillium freii TaxID=48697 RepID=A0A101M8M5_PENFR|nr:hypothetical protein ACN42_g11209 [Penicillium freii]
MFLFYTKPYTYDHRVWKTGLPVRSAVLKPHAGELVVGWVTTSESSLLYVLLFVFLSCRGRADRLKSIYWMVKTGKLLWMRLSLPLPLFDREGCQATGNHSNLHLCLKTKE